MHDLWAHWSRTGRRLHFWIAAAFVFLTLSGLVFYLPTLRGFTAGIRHVLRLGHVYAGWGAAALAAAALWNHTLRGKLLRRGRVKADLVLGLAFIVLLTITGIPLWLPERFTIELRNLAIFWHTRVGLAAAVWLGYHAVTGWLLPLIRLRLRLRATASRPRRERLSGHETPRPVPVYSRRDFVRQVGWATAALALLGLARPWELRVLRDRAAAALRGATGTASAFGASSPGDAPTGAAVGGAADLQSEAERKLLQFRIYTVTQPMPEFDPATYRFVVDGLVERPLDLSWAEVEALPAVREVSDFHCVTGWGVADVAWEGVRIDEIIARVRPDPRARYITFYSMDGVYTDSLSLDQTTADGVLLAYKMLGAPLRREHGAPLRLHVPQMYGYKGVKWLWRLEFTDRQVVGFWERYGYPIDAYLGT